MGAPGWTDGSRNFAVARGADGVWCGCARRPGADCISDCHPDRECPHSHGTEQPAAYQHRVFVVVSKRMEKPLVRPFFIRNLEAGKLLETFLVSAVAAFLGVRFFLGVTGYPRLGGGGLHIAHMLWGGALMVAGVLLLLSYLGQRVRRAAAVVAGLGFGLFIDELGKLITSGNDYFYRPAIALIYVVFVLLFLWWRSLERHRVWDE